MKQSLIVALALSLLFQPMAQAGWRGQEKSLSFGEFMCGVIGGVGSGAIAHKVIGSDPLTLVAGIVGGLAGANYCGYLRDEEQQTLRRFLKDGLEGRVGDQRRVDLNDFFAFVEIRGIGYRMNVGNNEMMEGPVENICKKFEMSIYRRRGEFLGKSTGWACKDRNGSWNVVDKAGVIPTREEPSSSYSYDNNYNSGYNSPVPSYGGPGSIGVAPAPGHGGGSVDVSPYPGHGGGSIDVSPYPPGYAPVPAPGSHGFLLNWDIRQIPHIVQDAGYQRRLQLMNRRGEVGFLKSVSPDGRSIQLYVNNAGYAPFHSVDDFGVECDVTPVCRSYEVTTRDGVSGTIRYLFRNGDVGIDSTYHGYVIRPLNSIY